MNENKKFYKKRTFWWNNGVFKFCKCQWIFLKCQWLFKSYKSYHTLQIEFEEYCNVFKAFNENEMFTIGK